jgi:hypothetical protein
VAARKSDPAEVILNGNESELVDLGELGRSQNLKFKPSSVPDIFSEIMSFVILH